MKPFYFGEREKALYGVYHPPVGEPRDSGVVLCYPFGIEYMEAHRAFRQLALRLSRSGFHVLRFDYYGTGDSAGDAGAGSVAQWLTDIETAVTELRDMAFVRSVSLVGFRLGGALAAMAASRLSDIEALVLWDPVIAGEVYVNEIGLLDDQRSSVASADCAQAPRGGCPIVAVAGFPVTQRLVEGLAGVNLLAAAEYPVGHIGVITTEERHEYVSLMEHLSEGRARINRQHIAGSANWSAVDGFTSAVLPPQVLEAIVNFLQDSDGN